MSDPGNRAGVPHGTITVIPRVIIYLAVVSLAALSLMSPASVDRQAEHCAHVPQLILTQEGLPIQARVLILEGGPFEIGHQHGCALQDEIRQAIRRVLNLCAGAPAEANGSCQVRAEGLRQALSDDLYQELKGIARGADVSETDMLILNLLAPEIEGGGALFAAWGDATLNGQSLLGRVGDGMASQDLLWMGRRPSNGRATIMLASPGLLGGWAGLSQQGMSGVCVSLMTADRSTAGLPIPIAMRSALEESATPLEASVRLKGVKHSGGALVVFADDQFEVEGLELSANLFRQMAPEASTFSSAGLFRDPDMQTVQLAVMPAPVLERAQARSEALERTLRANVGWIGVEKSLGALEALADSRSGNALLLSPAGSTLWYGDFRLDVKHLLVFNPWEVVEGSFNE